MIAVCYDGLDLGQKLNPRRATTNQGNPLPAHIIGMVPVCRVSDMALEVVQAGNLWPVPLIENTSC